MQVCSNIISNQVVKSNCLRTSRKVAFASWIEIWSTVGETVSWKVRHVIFFRVDKKWIDIGSTVGEIVSSKFRMSVSVVVDSSYTSFPFVLARSDGCWRISPCPYRFGKKLVLKVTDGYLWNVWNANWLLTGSATGTSVSWCPVAVLWEFLLIECRCSIFQNA